MEQKQNSIVATPYDDVFRTLLNDCSSLIIPVSNEFFQETFAGNEQVIFSLEIHFLNQQDGQTEKRITDSSFRIIGAGRKSLSVNARVYPTAACWSEFSNMPPREHWTREKLRAIRLHSKSPSPLSCFSGAPGRFPRR